MRPRFSRLPPWRTSVLRQNSQTPWNEADDLKTTGAPQVGQLAEKGFIEKPF
jgi:hypothetical protein